MPKKESRTRQSQTRRPIRDADLLLPLKVARERCNRSFEHRYVEAALQRHQGNVAAAARAAGVDRMYFYRLLRRYGLR